MIKGNKINTSYLLEELVKIKSNLLPLPQRCYQHDVIHVFLNTSNSHLPHRPDIRNDKATIDPQVERF